MMRYLTLSIALGFLLATANPARAQAVEIQDKVKDAIRKEKPKGIHVKEIQENGGLSFVREAHVTKGTLEDMLAQALNNNPDIRVAEAKMREAEAEFNRVKLQVTMKVVAQQREIEVCKAALKERQVNFERMQKLYNSRAIEQAILTESEAKLQKAKADLARMEADLPYLLGSPPHAWPPSSLGVQNPDPFKENVFAPFAPPQNPKAESIGFFPPALALIRRGQPPVEPRHTPIPEAMASKIRKALDTLTPADFAFTQTPPKQILDALQQYTKGINLVVVVAIDKAEPVTLHLKEPVPVGAIFQFLEDQYPPWRFVVREYGIVFAPGSMPPGAVRLQDFWKSPPRMTSTTVSPATGQKK